MPNTSKLVEIVNVREELIKLLNAVSCNGNGESLGSCPDRKHGLCGEVADLSYCVVQNLANHLIANGVMVQKRGQWRLRKNETHEDDYEYRCSVCGKHAPFTESGLIDLTPYCPGCYSKMDRAIE